jgi:large subunit ribosomal protein L13
MKTLSAKPHEVQHDWFIVDAAAQNLGRLAAQIAIRLMGKHKPIYTPHVDTGDFIIVINAEKIATTGNKLLGKTYWRHTGFPGGIKSMTLEKMMERYPERVVELAVKRMLPRGPLGRKMFTKLKVYPQATHPHAAQCPKSLILLKNKSKESA